jgi:purine-cytosine permease-like protein
MEPVTTITVNVYIVWLLSVVVGFGLVCGVCVALAVAEIVKWVTDVPIAFVRGWAKETALRRRPKPR